MQRNLEQEPACHNLCLGIKGARLGHLTRMDKPETLLIHLDQVKGRSFFKMVFAMVEPLWMGSPWQLDILHALLIATQICNSELNYYYIPGLMFTCILHGIQ